jgi:hypothetical protein
MPDRLAGVRDPPCRYRRSSLFNLTTETSLSTFKLVHVCKDIFRLRLPRLVGLIVNKDASAAVGLRSRSSSRG